MVLACSLVLVALSASVAFASSPQVIVELHQDTPNEYSQTDTFPGQRIGQIDAVTKQEYKFQRERDGTHFTYAIGNLDPGAAYQVELSFVEHSYGSAGRRVFNVFLQGATVVPGLDIFAVAGANNAYQRTFSATADSKGVLNIEFRSDVAGCAGRATISTIRLSSGAATVVEVDASASRNTLKPPPPRHYNTTTQNSYEAILGRLGSRASLDLMPQQLACRFSSLGTWTADASDLVVATRQGDQIRALPLTDRFPAWETINQSETMTTVKFDCSSAALPFELTATFRAPFYPQDEKVSTAPFFYIDITARNTGSTPASGTVLLARPQKEQFSDAGIQVFSNGNAGGIRNSTSYSYEGETFSQLDSKSANEALALPVGEEPGVRFRGGTPGEFSDFSPNALWGWSYSGYPAAPSDVKNPVFTFIPRGYTGAEWDLVDVAPGGSVTKHFVLAGYISDPVLKVENSSSQDGLNQFLYTSRFGNVSDVVDYAVSNMGSGDDIVGKSNFFDSTVASSDYLEVNPSYGGDVRNLIASSFRTFLTNTWWVRSPSGRDWFSVWEGTWMRFHGTVDVEYNEAWFYYDFWPQLMPKIFDEWLLYTRSCDAGLFIPHDIGIGDVVKGQTYDHDMPVEENLNFATMLYRYWKASGDDAYVRSRFDVYKKLIEFVMACDTNGNGIPERYCHTTFDDATPALENGADQSYLGFKCLAAYKEAGAMASSIDPAFAQKCEAQVALLNQTLEHDLWLSDHYAVCLDGGVDPADLTAYSINSGNGLLYLLGAQRDSGLTSANFDHLRKDIETSTAMTWQTYGSGHTSFDRTRMWVSSNIWRDALAGYTGAKPRGASPLSGSTAYWNLE